MPANVSMDEITQAALQGIIKAQHEYADWSGGEWLWHAPEYVSTVFVAKEVASQGGAKYVTVENSAATAMDDAGARGRGRLSRKIRENGRFDILLWWANGFPRAPIEEKRQVTGIEKISADLQRIEKVVRRKQDESSFQFGIVIFYSSCCDDKNISAAEKLEQRLKSIKVSSRVLIKDCFIKMINSEIYTKDDSAWVASAIVLKPNPITPI
jgi:hypothetical protein